MKNFFRYRKMMLVLAIMLVTTGFWISCATREEPIVPDSPSPSTSTIEAVGYNDYAPTQSCAGCHAEAYQKHLKTAHFLTGQPSFRQYILGSFKKGKNEYWYSPDIRLVMEHRDSSCYQVAYFKGAEKKAMRFDMVIGSGVLGQSYLTFRGNRLFQLPITYFTAADQWSNSPGFPSGKVMIDRPVSARCLECHISYAQPMEGEDLLEPKTFDQKKFIYGVDCQKCHGPAAKHVSYQLQHPEDKKASFIVNPAKLNPALQLDVCGLCHGGNLQKTSPSFSFQPGNPLSEHFTVDSITDPSSMANSIDVHGNQLGLLKASACFRNTPSMTCSSCHNIHENQRGQTALFSGKCQQCHSVEAPSFQTPAHANKNLVKTNCIDCHMPLQTSRAIAVDVQGSETPKASKLRSHWIAIYKNSVPQQP